MGAGFKIRELERVVICTLEATCTVEALEAIRSAVSPRRDRPSVMVLVPEGVGLPPHGVRRVAMATLRELDPLLGAWVVVLRTNALARAGFRALVGGILIAKRIEMPVVLFDTTARAADWLTLRGLFSGSATELEPVEAAG